MVRFGQAWSDPADEHAWVANPGRIEASLEPAHHVELCALAKAPWVDGTVRARRQIERDGCRAGRQSCTHSGYPPDINGHISDTARSTPDERRTDLVGQLQNDVKLARPGVDSSSPSFGDDSVERP